jgi:DNA-binding response OmpR family regulator
MRVLIVDDDRMFSEPLIWQLREEDYKVTYCQSIEDVLDEKGELKVPPPDCIILDIMMPRGDKYSKNETDAGKSTGLRFLQDVERAAPNTPVIIITIRNDLDEDEVRKRFGFVKKCLLKPEAIPTEVVKAIKEVCSQNIGG